MSHGTSQPCAVGRSDTLKSTLQVRENKAQMLSHLLKCPKVLEQRIKPKPFDS